MSLGIQNTNYAAQNYAVRNNGAQKQQAQKQQVGFGAYKISLNDRSAPNIEQGRRLLYDLCEKLGLNIRQLKPQEASPSDYYQGVVKPGYIKDIYIVQGKTEADEAKFLEKLRTCHSPVADFKRQNVSVNREGLINQPGDKNTDRSLNIISNKKD